jgi:hypothetical protein
MSRATSTRLNHQYLTVKKEDSFLMGIAGSLYLDGQHNSIPCINFLLSEPLFSRRDLNFERGGEITLK